MKLGTTLERIAIGVASLVLSIGLIALLSGFFANRDQAGISGGAAAIGQQFKDLGHAHLAAGELRPPYNSNPPTSGAHIPEPIHRNETAINDDQLLEALEVGDVVFMYGGRMPPPGLAALARSIAPRFTPALAAAGQAVILGRRAGSAGGVGLAWTHLLRVSSAGDPLLSQFAQYWLGRGAPGR